MVSRILDQFGRPLDVATIAEPQTSQTCYLHRELASHPTRGLTPSRLAAILDDAEAGDVVAQYEVFDDMEEKDGHVASEMGKRRRAVAGLEWSIEPPPNPSAREIDNAARTAELFQQKVNEGVEPFYLFSMFIRQFRLLIQTKALLEAGERPPGIASHLNQRLFVAEKLARQARNYTVPQLEQIYRRLLDIDVQAKTGKTDLLTALHLLVAGLTLELD